MHWPRKKYWNAQGLEGLRLNYIFEVLSFFSFNFFIFQEIPTYEILNDKKRVKEHKKKKKTWDKNG